MDTLLAIASRRDERRTLPEPLPPELTDRLLDAGRLSGSSRNAQPWTFVVPTGQARIEELARAVSVPENVLGAGLVVAVLVHGKGPVLFDAGRAAQSMLLAAWAEGLASCPNGITDVDLARPRSRAADDETPVIVLSFGLPERPRDAELAHGRGVERAGKPQVDRRGGAMAVRDEDERWARPRRDEDPGRRDERRGDRARERTTGDTAQGRARGGRVRARRGVCARRSTTRASSRWVLPGIGVGAPGSIDAETGTVLQVPNIDGWDEPFPLGPTLAAELGRPVRIGNDVNVAVDAEHRFGAGRGLELVPRRVLGHRGRRWHRHGRPAADRARLGRRDRARVLEARRPPLQLRARGLRRGIRGARCARGPRTRAREGSADGAVRADGEARPRPAHERRLAAGAAGGRRGRGGADPRGRSRRSASGSARP